MGTVSAYIGELAAIATAFLWMLSSLCWTAAGERIGSLAVNVIRLLVALPMLMACLWITEGVPVPCSASAFMRLIYKERIGFHAVAGSLLAFAGVALLFLK